MSGYCQAGKCECKHMRLDGIYCEADKALEGLRLIVSFEQCPWPSRQVKVEPHTYKPWADEYDKMQKEFHIAGLAEGIRRCREAVDKIAESHPDINVNAENGWVKLSVIIAAIDAVKGE